MKETTVSNENLTAIADKYNQVLQKIYDKFFPSFVDSLFENFADVIQKITENLLTNPVELIKYQLQYYTAHGEMLKNLSDYKFPNDKRFNNDKWQNNMLYLYLRSSYHLTSDFMEKIVANLEFENEKQKNKAIFFIKQLSNAFSPTNFCWSNPDIIEEFYETNGTSLLKGLDNLLNDLEHSNKVLNIRTTNSKYFKLGENIAATKGEVVFQNDLLQLIHYYPLQEKNYEVPILIVPPCINKYYILDLSPKNSFVKWLLEQGFSVFMISWKNPDSNYKEIDFDDYIIKGIIKAYDFILKEYNYKKISAVGYCIGGTMLTLANAYLSEKKQNNIVSNLMLTTMLDFQDGGEIALFIDEKSVGNLENSISEQGYIDGSKLSNSFSMLRANDMIWHFYVNNYLLGRDPFPFDILYWNSDSTKLPAKMYLNYIRSFYLNNILTKSKKIKLGNLNIELSSIKSPMYFLAAKDDHIVPWKSCLDGLSLLPSNLTKFVLTGAGHVAGVINPPSAGKYYYYNNLDIGQINKQQYLENLHKVSGSWWSDWLEWQKQFAGKKKKASLPIQSLESAPGSYIKE
jgi:polyhydroxyalkanoate synthase